MKKSRITIRHAISGRLRFSVNEILHAYERAILLEKWLSQKHGIIKIEVRAQSGSVIVCYTPKETNPEDIRELLILASDICPGHAYSRSSRMPSVCAASCVMNILWQKP